jgi:hypothetical protein
MIDARAGFLLAAAILLAGCASVPAEQQFRNQPPMAVKPDMALMYFYRDSSQVGCALTIDVDELHKTDTQTQGGEQSQTDGQDQGDQGQEIGALSNGSYFGVYMPPGKHTLYGTAWHHDKTSYLDIDLEAGKTYYVRGFFYRQPFAGGTGTVVVQPVDPGLAIPRMAALPRADEGLGVMSNCL